MRRKLRPQKPPGLPSQLPFPTCCSWMSVGKPNQACPALLPGDLQNFCTNYTDIPNSKRGTYTQEQWTSTGNAAPKHFPHAWESIVKPDAFLEITFNGSFVRDILFFDSFIENMERPFVFPALHAHTQDLKLSLKQYSTNGQFHQTWLCQNIKCKMFSFQPCLARGWSISFKNIIWRTFKLLIWKSVPSKIKP